MEAACAIVDHFRRALIGAGLDEVDAEAALLADDVGVVDAEAAQFAGKGFGDGVVAGQHGDEARSPPKPATATATLASPPPKVAMNCGDCRKRSNPGGARRSMISPNDTTSLDIGGID